MTGQHPHPGTPHRRIVGGIPCPDLDLSDVGPDDLLGAAVRTRLQQIFAAIVGVSVVRIDGHARGPKTLVSLELSGWSPSLHLISAQYMVTMDRPAARVPDQVAEAFRPHAMEQLGRSMAGMHLRLTAPLPLSGRNGPGGVRVASGHPEMRHLLVDASWPAVAASAGEDPVAALAKTVSTLHNGAIAWSGGNHLEQNGRVILECGLGRLVADSMDVPIADVAVSASYDGLALIIYGRAFPETALVAASGRPLRDLVELHPALDGRIVREAESEPDKGRQTVIQFEPLLIPFGDVASAASEHAS